MNNKKQTSKQTSCSWRRILLLSITMFLLQVSRSVALVSSARSSSRPFAAFASIFAYKKEVVAQGRCALTTTTSTTLSSTRNTDEELTAMLVEETGYRRPAVQWYPGHIAKAERQLSETLKAVDVVVEVRDARACKATAHPRVGEWCAGSPRIVVLTHLDMIPKSAANAWKKAYDTLGAERWDDAPINTQVANQAQQAREVRFQYNTGGGGTDDKKNNNQKSASPAPTATTPVEQVLFVNAKQGQGIHALHRAIFKAGSHVQERRERRGLKERALRVGIIGYPNVGKSALINKILGRKRARTANMPGVTRSLQWIRVKTDEAKTKKEFELLDSPGIIPAKMVDQSDALLLAACNCIGSAAYDNQAVAAYLCEWLKAIHIMKKEHVTAPEWRNKCIERYGFDPMEKQVNTDSMFEDDDEEGANYLTGEDMLFLVADNTCRGDPEDASRKILQDFRAGRMGPISLQVAPETEDDAGQLEVPLGQGSYTNPNGAAVAAAKREWVDQQELQQERARIAMETAKERGLELPPMVVNHQQQQQQQQENNNQAAKQDKKVEKPEEDDIGKGMFDGW